MFRITAQDLRKGNRSKKIMAGKFLRSRWFDDICCGISMPTERVREMIKYGKVASRVTYE